MKRILVTGGAGYVGHALVPHLLADGYKVVVFDTFWFGDFLPKHPNLTSVHGDMRDAELVFQAAQGCDAVIHLACISATARSRSMSG